MPAKSTGDTRDARGRVPAYAASRAAALRREIGEHNRRYYVDDAPTISDAAYDALFRELQELESRYPDLVTDESPTQKVGAAARTDFAPVRHAVPMLSIRTETDTVAGAALKFDARVRRELGLGADDAPVDYLAELTLFRRLPQRGSMYHSIPRPPHRRVSSR